MKKKKTYAKLKEELDKVFSVFIRMRDRGICFTCYKKFDWKDTDAGHFINRNHLATRWLEENVHCQCQGCNRFRQGNKADYAVHLELMYGHGILQKLKDLRDKGAKIKYSDIEKMIGVYKKKIDEMVMH